jgi:hypothetical protein
MAGERHARARERLERRRVEADELLREDPVPDDADERHALRHGGRRERERCQDGGGERCGPGSHTAPTPAARPGFRPG